MSTEVDHLEAADAGLAAVVAHGILNALQSAVMGPRFFEMGADPHDYCPMIRRSLRLAIDSAEDLEPPSGPQLRIALLPAVEVADELESRIDGDGDGGAAALELIRQAARRAEDIVGGLVRGLPADAVVYLDELSARRGPSLD